MLVHVLVAVVFVDFQTQGGHLGQDAIGKTGIHQQVDASTGIRSVDQLDQFITHALCGDDLDAVGHFTHGLAHFRAHFDLQLRSETCRSHHAQRIVREGDIRRTGSPDLLVGQRRDTVERVDQL